MATVPAAASPAAPASSTKIRWSADRAPTSAATFAPPLAPSSSA
ncbi:MAG TPA: hypothetical protein VHT95_04500 [Vicinamibacterales bacterium]|nr:hypothetical protein [Vicinamibacterales bacterium]